MGMGSSWCPRSPCCGKSDRQARLFTPCGLFKPHWLGRRLVPVLLKRREVLIGRPDLATQGRKRIASILGEAIVRDGMRLAMHDVWIVQSLPAQEISAALPC